MSYQSEGRDEPSMAGHIDDMKRPTVAERRRPPISDSVESLQSAITELQDVFSILQDKVGGVTGPDMNDSRTVDPTGDRVPLSPLADEIFTQSRRVHNLRMNMRDLIERIELSSRSPTSGSGSTF